MAYVRAHETKQKRNGKPVKTYAVVWREPVRRSGLPIPAQTARARGARRTRLAKPAEATPGRAECGAAHDRDQRPGRAAQGGRPAFGYYARAWLDSQRVKAAPAGKVKADTVDGYEKRLAVYALPEFGAKAIASITPTHCEQFLAALVARGDDACHAQAPLVGPAQRVRVRVRHKAIRRTLLMVWTFRQQREASQPRHHPLTAEQVAAVAASVGTRYPVYELLTLFAAYTGLRAEELAGLEVGDLVFTPGPEACAPAIDVSSRAKKRRGGEWVPTRLRAPRAGARYRCPG